MRKYSNDFMTLLVISLLIPALVFIYFYFSESKKNKDEPKLPSEEEISVPRLLCSPQITVVFQSDLANDEELAREIADMYISNRAYYYLGKPMKEEEVLSEREIWYDNIDFSSLKAIDV